MKCPYCAVSFHENWVSHPIYRGQHDFMSATGSIWRYRTAICPGCKLEIIEIGQSYSREEPEDWRMVCPRSSVRGPVPVEVPAGISTDFVEACNVLSISAKASAALSRRCLQNILHSNGYKARDLGKEIDLLQNEQNPRKALPLSLHETIDGIRNFGNFSAHPLDDKTSLQIIEVEEHEAEWCLEIIEELFEHFYVKPAASKAKKAALNAKLTLAGKPSAK